VLHAKKGKASGEITRHLTRLRHLTSLVLCHGKNGDGGGEWSPHDGENGG
jgi:hypothetical protein